MHKMTNVEVHELAKNNAKCTQEERVSDALVLLDSSIMPCTQIPKGLPD